MMTKRILIAVAAIFFFTLGSCDLINKDNGVGNDLDEADTVDITNCKHLVFKGVPIDGTLKQFVKRMEKVGFSRAYVSDDGTACLEGDFAGCKGCTVAVSTIIGNDIVAHIEVDFPQTSQWEQLYGDYKNLKDMLTKKYGNPSLEREEFIGYHCSSMTDRGLMIHVKNDECKYEAHFETEKGNIMLTIEPCGSLGPYGGHVSLTYTDALNSSIITQQAYNDL